MRQNHLSEKKTSFSKHLFLVLAYVLLLIIMSVQTSNSGEMPGEEPPSVNHSDGKERKEKTIHASNLPRMKFENGKLTARIRSVPLEQVMTFFTQLTGIKIMWLGSEIHRPVSFQMVERPIEEAIQQILRGEDYALFYASTGKEKTIEKILILPGGNGSQSIPDTVAPEAPAIRVRTTSELDRDLLKEDREKAAESLIDSMTNDPEPEVRLEALQILHQSEPLPVEMLKTIAMSEADPRVKLQVLNYLVVEAGQNPEAVDALNEISETDQ